MTTAASVILRSILALEGFARVFTPSGPSKPRQKEQDTMLSLYRPFSCLFQDDLGDDFGNQVTRTPSRGTESFSPAVDVVEKDNAYLIQAEVPGLSSDEIEVTVENDVLTLKGKRSRDREESVGYRRVERSYGSFSRSFVVPRGTNPDAIEARTEHGILTVSIPKAAISQPRKVQIKAEGLADRVDA